MNPRPQNIQKREIFVEQEVKKKYNPEPSFTLKKSLVSEFSHEYILITPYDFPRPSFCFFFLGFRRPNLISGLGGWRVLYQPLRTQEPVPDRRTRASLNYGRPNQIPYEWVKQITILCFPLLSLARDGVNPDQASDRFPGFVFSRDKLCSNYNTYSFKRAL